MFFQLSCRHREVTLARVSRVYTWKKKGEKTQIDSRRYEKDAVSAGSRATFLTAFYSFPLPAFSRDRVFRARVKFTPRFRENERRKRGERGGKKRGGRERKREGRRPHACSCASFAAGWKSVCSLREHVAGPLSRWIRILRIDRRSPVALVRNLLRSITSVQPFPLIVSRLAESWRRDAIGTIRDYDVCETLAKRRVRLWRTNFRYLFRQPGSTGKLGMSHARSRYASVRDRYVRRITNDTESQIIRGAA